jgi:hypothetical protein
MVGQSTLQGKVRALFNPTFEPYPLGIQNLSQTVFRSLHLDRDLTQIQQSCLATTGQLAKREKSSLRAGPTAANNPGAYLCYENTPSRASM